MEYELHRQREVSYRIKDQFKGTITKGHIVDHSNAKINGEDITKDRHGLV